MRLPADYHSHTCLCRHATGKPTEYAAAARRVGLQEIGFTDHAPMPEDDFDDWRMPSKELDLYVAWVQEARQDHPDLNIRLGLEVDYLPGLEPWIQDLTRRHPWDYLIGSVHYLFPGWAVDDPRQIREWEKRDPVQVWQLYVERLTAAAKSGLFDVIGHVDLPKKFGFRPPDDVVAFYRPFLLAARKAGVAIELNTAGLRKECREIYPGRALLEAAHREGIPITFSSDAHAPEEMGAGFQEAVALARSVGYDSWRRLQDRTGESAPLGG